MTPKTLENSHFWQKGMWFYGKTKFSRKGYFESFWDNWLFRSELKKILWFIEKYGWSGFLGILRRTQADSSCCIWEISACTIQSWGGEANGKGRRGQTRRDSKRRVLRPGESVRADGKYQYKYHIDGKPHFVYSWKLESTDKLPKGKKPCLSLRKLEKQVNTDLDLLVNIVDGQMTVCELVDWYLKTKTGVRQSTKQGYVTVQRLFAKESFQAIIEDRNAPKVEKTIDGYSGFLFYDDNGMLLVAMHW